MNAYRRYQPGSQPSHNHPPYVSSQDRHPSHPPIVIPHTLSEVTGPQFTLDDLRNSSSDLTKHGAGEPLGERIVVSGRVLDQDGNPIRRTLVEIWQANAAGRYMHKTDRHNAPLDPNFPGFGHTLTDDEGRYRFVTIKPGAYPWRNHHNAWRPQHIHFSLFGPAFATRIVTQMYFPGDPLLPFDPIYNCTADEKGRKRLISCFDWETTIPDQALGFRFDITLRGRDATPLEEM
jgi:protocatechuate 3,4-dioxygenase beta subunit